MERSPTLAAPPAPSRSIWDQEDQRRARTPAVWREDEGVTSLTGHPETGARSDEPKPQRSPSSPGLEGQAVRGDNGQSREVIAARKRGAEAPRAKPVWRRQLVAAIALVVVVALLADVAYALLGIRSSLTSAKSELKAARSSLVDGDVGGADAHAEQSADSTSEALDFTRRPGLQVVKRVPWLGDNLEAVDSLVRAGALVSDAAATGVDGARLLGLSDDGVGASIYRNGRVDFASLEDARPLFEGTERLLGSAASILEQSPAPTLDAVKSAFDEARADITEAVDSLRNGTALFSLLPSLLGQESQRSYLLAFQALGEARGTGGVIGLYGILDIADGRPRLTHVGPFTDFHPRAIDDVAAPNWFERSYGPQLALSEWQQANLSPNFPAVAPVLLEMYKEATGRSLDGVIAMDPVALAEFLRGTGPIRAPGLDVRVGPANAADVLMRDAYLQLPLPREQNRYLSTLVDKFWERIRAGDFEPADFAAGVAKAVKGQHLKVYSRDGEDMEALETLGATGAYDVYGPNVQLVFNDNYSANKVDYYLYRTIDTKVQLYSTGEAQVLTTVTLENTAPRGPKSPLLGPAPEPGSKNDPPGLNRMLLNFLLPEGARALWEAPDQGSIPARYADQSFPVFWRLVEITAGGTEEIAIRYTVPDAVELVDGGGTFDLALFPQATVNVDHFTLTVAPPVGSAIGDSEDSLGTLYKTEGVLSRPRSYELTVVRP